MPWSTPVTDRTQADIIAQNAKAYINAGDWTRIYDNALIINGLFSSEIGYDIDFDTLPAVAIAHWPTNTYVNTLLKNIERMRLWAATYLGDYIFPDSNFIEIKDDWLSGQENTAPNFVNANTWEYVLLVLYNLLSAWTPPSLTGNWEFLSGDWELVAGGYLEHV